MSKENNPVKDILFLMKKDIKDYKAVILSVAAYFCIMQIFFHTTCIFTLATGYPCPGCGLTRAGFLVLTGDWKAAWHMNLFIFPIVILAGILFWNRYVVRKSSGYLIKYAVVLMAGMGIYYIYRMITMFPGKEPMVYYAGNMLRTLLNLRIR